MQQLEMLKHMRKFHLDDQSVILEKVPAYVCLFPYIEYQFEASDIG